jgi:hypothetical protein
MKWLSLEMSADQWAACEQKEVIPLNYGITSPAIIPGERLALQQLIWDAREQFRPRLWEAWRQVSTGRWCGRQNSEIGRRQINPNDGKKVNCLLKQFSINDIRWK